VTNTNGYMVIVVVLEEHTFCNPFRPWKPSQSATPDGSTSSTRIAEATISPSILRPCGQKNAEQRYVTSE
jgi:hypothetical protein